MSADPNIELRMHAYYYGFDKTGEPSIDRILSAVAWAGKAFHGTYQWNEEAGERPGHEGNTPVEWMQNAGQYAAAELAIMRADLAASRAECERYREALTGILEQSQAVSATARIARQALEPK